MGKKKPRPNHIRKERPLRHFDEGDLDERKERANKHADLDQPPLLWSEDTLYDRLADAKDTAPLILILDCVQDPHNLGACMRSADAAGVLAVICPKDKSATLTDAARRVACGATENTPFVQVTNLARCLTRLKELGLWLVGTADEAEQTIHQADFKGPLAILMGAEGTGLRRLTREHCDFLVNIPMAKSRKVDCLNVSVATGVLLFEAFRQRAAPIG
ncbi:MAG: 23S rRNA (guanosine2251-2'-O)-methyltransferase [Verrucomicrobiales bacterium]|jgi:23S rRNA (guanosine2251-2'-O)-methyltransferase